MAFVNAFGSLVPLLLISAVYGQQPQSDAMYPGMVGGYGIPQQPGYGAGGGYQGAPAGAAQFPHVSCPNLFSYQNDPVGMGGWYGLVVTPKSRYDQEFDLEVNMTVNKAVAQSDNIKLNVLSAQDEIFHGDAIKWSIKFPYQDVLPKLTQIKFNHQILCVNQPDPLVSGVTQTSMWAKAVIRTSTGGGQQPQQQQPQVQPLPYPGSGGYQQPMQGPPYYAPPGQMYGAQDVYGQPAVYPMAEEMGSGSIQQQQQPQ